MTAAQQVAAWSRKAREATAYRDQAVRAMRATGASLRDIAVAADLSHTQIANILARVTADPPNSLERQ